VGLLVIILLVGHIFYAAISRIAKVEDDYRKMMELKVRAEAADVAKSQVHVISGLIFGCSFVVRNKRFRLLKDGSPFFSWQKWGLHSEL
jgi:hypothetical protein